MKKISIGFLALISFFLILSVGCNKDKGVDLPTVKTSQATSITSNSALTGGSVVNDQTIYVVARGVCYSTAPHPTVGNLHTIDGKNMWEFVSQITGLSAKTKYYYRAYATVEYGGNYAPGTGYGPEYSFTTLP